METHAEGRSRINRVDGVLAMSRMIVTDAAVLAQFRVLAETTDLTPAERYWEPIRPQSAEPPYGIKSPYSAAELDAFEREPGRPLTDVWKSLGRA